MSGRVSTREWQGVYSRVIVRVLASGRRVLASDSVCTHVSRAREL